MGQRKGVGKNRELWQNFIGNKNQKSTWQVKGKLAIQYNGLRGIVLKEKPEKPLKGGRGEGEEVPFAWKDVFCRWGWTEIFIKGRGRRT